MGPRVKKRTTFAHWGFLGSWDSWDSWGSWDTILIDIPLRRRALGGPLGGPGFPRRRLFPVRLSSLATNRAPTP